MSVPSAYLGVILIWTTTPLAIRWSSEGGGFLFGASSRMVIAAVLALAVAALLGDGLRWDRKARRAYLAAGLGIYFAMSCVYWSAQHIPSGWISVLFGLSPLITGLLARRWLDDAAFGPGRLLGTLFGVAGLAMMFGGSFQLNVTAAWGVGAVLLGTTIHSASSVAIKRIEAQVPAMVMAAGGLVVAAPLFALTWALADGTWPQALPTQALASIIYLAVFGSVLGFALFYYVLHRLAPTQVALITLITPVGALLLGYGLEGEPITAEVVGGTSMILLGLAAFQFGDRLLRPVPKPATTNTEAE